MPPKYKLPYYNGIDCSCDSCDIPCNICGYTELNQFSSDAGFNLTQTDNSLFPFFYSGTNFTGVTPVENSDIQIFTTGLDTYFQKANSIFNTGFPYIEDDANIKFDGVTKRNVTIEYEYYLSTGGPTGSGGKHGIVFSADSSIVLSPTFYIGSWSDNFSNTIGRIQMMNPYPNICVDEYPPIELNLLPQTLDEWRFRKIEKINNIIYYTDGNIGPIEINRCWFRLCGQIALRLGWGVRVRNISITLN